MFYSDISNATKLDVFSVIESCNALETKEEFRGVFQKINHLIGQEMSSFGMGDIRTAQVISTVSAGFPADFMSSIIDPSGRMNSPLFYLWLQSQSPQILEFSDDKNLPDIDILKPYLDFSFHNVISHGVIDYSQQYMTYFGFAEIPERIGKHHINLLNILAPVLHVAYSELIKIENPLIATLGSCVCSGDAESSIATDLLTKRELNVLSWLSEGKSNFEIARILIISENTVKSHLKNIFKKLAVNNRHHAVAVGFKMKLIEL